MVGNRHDWIRIYIDGLIDGLATSDWPGLFPGAAYVVKRESLGVKPWLPFLQRMCIHEYCYLPLLLFFSFIYLFILFYGSRCIVHRFC